jgi:hypothetical protein
MDCSGYLHRVSIILFVGGNDTVWTASESRGRSSDSDSSTKASPGTPLHYSCQQLEPSRYERNGLPRSSVLSTIVVLFWI